MSNLDDLRSALVRLKSARASGVFEIQFSDRRVRYRSDKELLAAIAALEDEIAEAQGVRRPRNLIVVSNKGY